MIEADEHPIALGHRILGRGGLDGLPQLRLALLQMPPPEPRARGQTGEDEDEEQQEQPDLDLDDKEVRHMRLWPSSPRTSPTARVPTASSNPHSTSSSRERSMSSSLCTMRYSSRVKPFGVMTSSRWPSHARLPTRSTRRPKLDTSTGAVARGGPSLRVRRSTARIRATSSCGSKGLLR